MKENEEIEINDKKSKFKKVMEWVYCVLLAIILVIIIKAFVGTPTIVKQTSMYPTLKQNQRLWLNKLGVTFNKMPERGDIVTFESPSSGYVNAINANLENAIAE